MRIIALDNKKQYIMQSPYIEILLVEDDPGDIELTRKAFLRAKIRVNLAVVSDGDEALAYLHREGEYPGVPRPDLILLDLNLPGLSGREVLQEIKSDKNLKSIPVVILTTSDSEEDILKAYNLGANCYVNKPLGLQEFMKNIESIKTFWLTVVKSLPRSG